MRITIRAPHAPVDDRLREYVRKKLGEALAHVEDRIESVQLTLDDLNGPKGGVDKLCQIVANCGHLGVVRVEGRDGTLRDAAEAAIDRAKTTINHAIEKKQTVQRSKVPHRRAER
jgi:ribosome-associated translation inhibitor RaiA